MTTANETRLPDSVLLTLDQVRVRLATLWFGGGGLLVFSLVIRSLLGGYRADVPEVFGWFLPTYMPTAGLILAVLGYTALDPTQLQAVVRKSFYQIAFWLSLAYLLLIGVTIFIQPFTNANAIDLMRMSNLWLGPVQGLVASALGVLFMSKKKNE